METIVRVSYDDHPNEVVDTIAGAVAQFGISIEEIDGGDGYIDYLVTKRDPNEK